MNPNRMTIEELKRLLDKHGAGNFELVCDNEYYEYYLSKIKPLYVHSKHLSVIDNDDNLTKLLVKNIKHYPSIENPEKTAYYKWRLYMRDGGIDDTPHCMNEQGYLGNGNLSCNFKAAVHREKISEAIYKVEGQE